MIIVHCCPSLYPLKRWLSPSSQHFITSVSRQDLISISLSPLSVSRIFVQFPVFRSGQAFVRDTEAGPGQPGHSKPTNIVIPDIVKPPAIPSAMKGSMKGSGSHPPRSPKDKVTFAEFTEVLPEKESAKVLSDSEKVTKTSEAVDSCNNRLEVPSDPAKVTMLDTISELPRVPLVIPESDLSPSSETSRLLAPVSDSQD